MEVWGYSLASIGPTIQWRKIYPQTLCNQGYVHDFVHFVNFLFLKLANKIFKSKTLDNFVLLNIDCKNRAPCYILECSFMKNTTYIFLSILIIFNINIYIYEYKNRPKPFLIILFTY